MQIISQLPRLLCVITYLFAIIITIWALYQPYMTTVAIGENIDIYMDKNCIGDDCDRYRSFYANSGTALNALYIIFVILASLCLVLSFTKYTKICNIVGIILLGMALAVMITLIIIVKTSYLDIGGMVKFYYNMTTASILVIVVCCLMIVKQLTYNNILHSIGRAVFSKLKH